MPKINNIKYLKSSRKLLRNNSTAAEATLWKILKNKTVCGLKFRRQHSVGNYILDFYCPELKLAIELDGEIHNDPVVLSKDLEKEEFLLKLSICLLRYENRWVYDYPEVIIEDILKVKEYLEKVTTSP
jgi:very-short-patch-repair endonuclease